MRTNCSFIAVPITGARSGPSYAMVRRMRRRTTYWPARNVLACSLAASCLFCGRLSADSRDAIRELRARKAEVRLVTEAGIIEGHTTLLPENQFYYSVAIGESWTGGNAGLLWLLRLR